MTPAALLLAALAPGCFKSSGKGTSADGDRKDASTHEGSDGGSSRCGIVGRSVACVGRGGCAGGQVCRADGTFGVCDCGAAPDDAGAGHGDPDADTAVDGSVKPPECGVGATCARPHDCEPGLSCIVELSLAKVVNGLPDGTNRLPLIAFPGGVCSPTGLVPWDDPRACDPLAPDGRQGCGDCGRCAGINLESGLVVACVEPCTPSRSSTGCSREGYTCDVDTRACMQGCVSDMECKIENVDTNGDGLGDMSRYNADSPGTCDASTLRCTRPGKPGAQAGDPCESDDDCEADGFCYEADRLFGDNPYTGGSCSKNGCNNEGFECAGGGVCTDLREWTPFQTLGFTCNKGCTLGAEAPELQTGTGGHGNTCRKGYMCLWTGIASSHSGVCVPGNYNDVEAPNLGASCSASSECFSPQGHGVCLRPAGGDSICTIMDCDAPGLGTNVCGDMGACVLLEDQRRSACLVRCTDASDCPAALGCISATGAPRETIGVCAPCTNAADCLTGQACDRGLCR